jgi:hypothetical protein
VEIIALAFPAIALRQLAAQNPVARQQSLFAVRDGHHSLSWFEIDG